MKLAWSCCLLHCLVTVAVTALRAEYKFEILETTKNSARVRFTVNIASRSYYINVGEKDMADKRADYYTTLIPSNKKGEYFYVDTGPTLTPGKLYEFSVTLDHGNTGSIDLTTDCDVNTHTCEKNEYPFCVPVNLLCDGHNDCSDGSDELKDENGTCLAKVPEKSSSPSPTPPTNTPCIRARTAAIAAGVSRRHLPECSIDGNYLAVRCELIIYFTCHCVNPINNGILFSQGNFSPFVHYNFARDCQKSREHLLQIGQQYTYTR